MGGVEGSAPFMGVCMAPLITNILPLPHPTTSLNGVWRDLRFGNKQCRI